MGADDRRLHCRSIWAAETLKRADVVEASRIAIVSPDAEDDPVGRAYGRRQPVWIEHLAGAGAAAGTRVALAIDAGLESLAAFPIADRAGAVGAIELYAPRARPADDGMLAMMAEVGHEICEVFRRQEAQATALEDVSRSRDELDLVLGAIPDGITVLDADGRIIYANDAAARISGFASAAEMLHAPGDDVAKRFQMWDEAGERLLPEDLPSSRARRGKRGSKLLRYRSHDGQLDGWVSLESVPITDDCGRVRRVVNVTHDVTKQRGVELDNVRLVGEAQEALRAREDLLAIVSHDSRSPLGVVLASTALLLKANLPPDKQDRARRQVEAIQRAGEPHEPADPRPARFRQHPGRAAWRSSMRPQAVAALVKEGLEVDGSALAGERSVAAPGGRSVADPGVAGAGATGSAFLQLFSNLAGNAREVHAATDGAIHGAHASG